METKKTKKDTKGSKEHKKSWQETYASIDDIMTFLDNLPLWNEDKDDYIMELAMSVIMKGGAEEQMLFCQCLKRDYGVY